MTFFAVWLMFRICWRYNIPIHCLFKPTLIRCLFCLFRLIRMSYQELFLSRQTGFAASSHCISMDGRMDGWAFFLFFHFMAFFLHLFFIGFFHFRLFYYISFLLASSFYSYVFFNASLFYWLLVFFCILFNWPKVQPGTRTDLHRLRWNCRQTRMNLN